MGFFILNQEIRVEAGLFTAIIKIKPNPDGLAAWGWKRVMRLY